MTEVHWGIIGCGDVTEKKSGPAFRKVEGSQLVAVMRRDGRRAADYATRHGVPRWYDDAERLISDPDVDAVYIATPPVAHAAYIRQVAEAGKPIYCEKPLGVSYAESREAVRFCAERNVPLYAAYYRRGLEKYRKVADLVREGKIGEVRCVQVAMYDRGPERTARAEPAELPWRVRPEVSGGGLILDVGSHALDLLDFYFGPIAEAKGLSSNLAGLYPAEDMVSGTWMFESGIHGSGMWCFVADRKEDQIEIFGTAGRIGFSVLDVDGPVSVSTGSGTEALTFDSPEHVQQPLIQLVVDELLGKAACPSTGESAMRTDRVIEQLRASQSLRPGDTPDGLIPKDEKDSR